jgi:hypothetical protein
MMVMKDILPKSDSVDALILSRQQTLLIKSHCTSKIKPPGVLFADATTSLGSQWLFATPNPSLGQVMEPEEYRVALAFRLLMPILPCDKPCLAIGCKRKEGLKPWIMDRYGYHALSCKCTGNLIIPRHERVVAAIGDLAHNASLNPKVNAEVTCLGESSSGNKLFKPADVLLDAPDGRRRDCVDITVSSPLSWAKASVGANVKPGNLVNTKADNKNKKHRLACFQAAKGFTPFSVDVCGMIEGTAALLLNRIACQQAKHSDRPYRDTISFCRRRVSFAIHHGVAKQLVAALSSSTSTMSSSTVVGCVDNM